MATAKTTKATKETTTKDTTAKTTKAAAANKPAKESKAAASKKSTTADSSKTAATKKSTTKATAAGDKKTSTATKTNKSTKTSKSTKPSKSTFEPSAPLSELAENLGSASRKDRQNSAAEIAEISKVSPQDLLPYGDAIVDALKRPEARTRWECFDALTNLVELDSKLCRKALDSAEESVFDETSGTVRLAAMRFLCKLGTASPRLATSSWPLIDEALQCYHGDPEYTDMLVAVNDFAASKLPKQVREELIERMEFDATNAKSGLLRRANSIIDAAKKK